ncbi:MAG: monovalent cation/H(+) antiporter subunit G [Gammaproteobacteria bacterium]|nr:monovalent cation/H(+) antiporter subunit G [Gammaproteobacteria bacterium]MCW8841579.1 monovalent cation/H(+) antiporter subunit G [Gammaproteobacteria bacterium]MCW8927573.1 monovalent cation/H(+) antiporter subunit G [Gammaproteobacteria bacterium]MCW8958289.1 monovalent cation/H(+) antiporter subunit G [Gammaproteobacteria bacterium]MCW8972904.1 monovalent cation/H(+) antiporter subunit G [Gammaproteobacteria bacterium]
MSVATLLALSLLAGGLFFFIAGTLGLLRFPDQLCRIHALTKADNVGLGLLSGSLALLSGSWAVALKLLLIWLLVMAAGATVAQLVAASHQAGREGDRD